MEYYARAQGVINGEPVRLSGAGALDMPEGFVCGSYAIENLAPGVDTLLFNCVLITGYPSACKVRSGVENPFHAGSYRYVRRIEFAGYDAIEYEAKCNVADDHLDSIFSIQGRVPELALVSSLPVVEVWKPGPDGTILGNFTMRWMLPNAEILEGHAVTTYFPPTAAPPLRAIFQREIALRNSKPTPNVLTVEQRSELRLVSNAPVKGPDEV